MFPCRITQYKSWWSSFWSDDLECQDDLPVCKLKLPVNITLLLVSVLLTFPRFFVVSLTKTRLVYKWSNLIADKCVQNILVYDDAMAQYEYKGVKLRYNHSKLYSRMYLTSTVLPVLNSKIWIMLTLISFNPLFSKIYNCVIQGISITDPQPQTLEETSDWVSKALRFLWLAI